MRTAQLPAEDLLLLCYYPDRKTLAPANEFLNGIVVQKLFRPGGCFAANNHSVALALFCQLQNIVTSRTPLRWKGKPLLYGARVQSRVAQDGTSAFENGLRLLFRCGNPMLLLCAEFTIQLLLLDGIFGSSMLN